jgi:hypothetical protein
VLAFALALTVALMLGAGRGENPGPAGPWWKVAVCEESGRNDPTYGYLGIIPQTWAAYGGRRFAPLAGGASWREQVTVARRIVGRAVPDQHGCAGAW